MLTNEIISQILEQFGLTFLEVTGFADTSRSGSDKRLIYFLDDKYVLKINASTAMWEERLQEISRLIGRYNAIGIYAPRLLPAKDGKLSCQWPIDGVLCTCFAEEFAQYPTYPWDADCDRGEVVEHLGLLAARHTDVDLSKIRSMWSLIDLAPLDIAVDEKQENCDTLVDTLKEAGLAQLADRVVQYNGMLRQRILEDFRAMPRCVYQGDLNNSNLLHRDGHFVGLLDFNLSGTDVNINVFVNETNWFPDASDFDSLSVPAILEKMEQEQNKDLSAILRHYSLNALEKKQLPNYKAIANLFQYPNVCQMGKWLRDDTRREKCVRLIECLILSSD